MPKKYVVYATCYPGVEPYVPQWRNSVLAQTDQDFDLAIGLDEISPEQAQEVFGADIKPLYLRAPAHNTPAGVRNQAFERLIRDYTGIIMTDMDDILLPDRVLRAKAMLSSAELCCCAMQIMENDTLVSGLVFDPGHVVSNILVRNVFGLSNTAYRSSLLKVCLPVPTSCVLMDWLLATRALAAGATIAFDPTPQMVYRQYPNNTARILPPFSPDQILKACELVLGHYRILLAEAPERFPRMLEDIECISENAKCFFQAMQSSRSVLQDYVVALNELPIQHVWWDCVAHPELEKIWKQ